MSSYEFLEGREAERERESKGERRKERGDEGLRERMTYLNKNRKRSSLAPHHLVMKITMIPGAFLWSECHKGEFLLIEFKLGSIFLRK